MELTLYVRAGCHLCEDMEFQLREILASKAVSLVVVDIGESPELERVFGTKVPVLMANDTEICHYWLDFQKLINYLNGAGA